MFCFQVNLTQRKVFRTGCLEPGMSLINRLIHKCIVAVEMSLVKPSPLYIHNCCLSVDKAMLAVIN